MAHTHVVSAAHDRDAFDRDAIKRALYGSGITTLRGAFPRALVDGVREDVDAAFAEAQARPDGAVGRGPNRYYVGLHPQAVRSFRELVTHPWLATVCETVLGTDYEIVALGLEIALPGATDQPWHRDYPSPIATAKHRRLTSLTFGLTCVDVTPELGPSQIARGTQWETGAEWSDGMFPPADEWPRYDALSFPKLPWVGDLSARSALAIHRATANHGDVPRPVLVIGAATPTAAPAHDALQVTPAYYGTLPGMLKKHLACRVVDELAPIAHPATPTGFGR